jgi:hypothetical protein
MRGGARVAPAPSLDETRATAAREVAALPGSVRALKDPILIPPRLSPRLAALKEDLHVTP